MGKEFCYNNRENSPLLLCFPLLLEHLNLGILSSPWMPCLKNQTLACPPKSIFVDFSASVQSTTILLIFDLSFFVLHMHSQWSWPSRMIGLLCPEIIYLYSPWGHKNALSELTLSGTVHCSFLWSAWEWTLGATVSSLTSAVGLFCISRTI